MRSMDAPAPAALADGVYRVEGLRVGNSYIVVGPTDVTVVDTGIRGNAKHVLGLLDRLGRQPSDVRTIVLTHWHIDHVGTAAELKRLTGARVAIHALDAPVLAGGELPRKGRRAMGLIVRLFGLRPLEPDLVLHDGDRIADFDVLHVPGHTDGSIALVRSDGVVVSGDALLGSRRGEIKPPDLSLSLDPDQALVSAERIKALPLRLLLPGHGAPARGR